jgi:hypothetical protein
MCSIYSVIKIFLFQVYYKRVPIIAILTSSGLLFTSITRGRIKKKIIRGILISYKNDTICRILKPDRRITRGIVVKAIKRIL